MSIREKSTLYPNVTWQDCKEFIKVIDSFKLKSVSYIEVAKKYGLSNVATKSFSAKISSSKQFDLITTVNGNTISLTSTSTRLLYPTGNELHSLELQCFSMPPLYQKLIAIYDGKALPQESILANILMTDHKITRSAKDAAAHCFIESATQLGLIQGGILCYSNSNTSAKERNQTNIPKDNDKQNDNENDSDCDCDNDNIDNANNLPLKKTDHEVLSIPLGQKRNAIMYMPVDATAEDAEYVKNMIEIMFKKLYCLQK